MLEGTDKALELMNTAQSYSFKIAELISVIFLVLTVFSHSLCDFLETVRRRRREIVSKKLTKHKSPPKK